MMILTLLLSVVLGSAEPALAQTSPDQAGETSNADAAGSGEAESTETLFREEEKAAPAAAAPSVGGEIKGESLGQIRRLEPFKDIAVIQRRYLPRTKRFELNGSTGLIINDAFFTNFSFHLRFTYSFSETYGIELIGMSNTSITKKITRDLKNQKGVTTEAIVVPQSYYGGALKYTPFYGKISWLNKSIVPFDHHFSLGGGYVSTNQGSNTAGVHLGTGQTYALSKRFAVRWDVSWMLFNTTSNVTGNEEAANYNNLYLTMGLSWFFPEVSYR